MSNLSDYMQSSLKFSEKTIQTPDTENEVPTKLITSNGTFFKEFIKGFYKKIIYTDSFDDFENLSIEWIKNTLGQNDMNVEIFFELIQNHKIWTSESDWIFLSTWNRMQS